jgi:hypothetical protein
MTDIDLSRLSELSHLSPRAKHLVKEIIHNLVDSKNISDGLRKLQQTISWDPVYNRPPADLEEFMLSPSYLGLSDPNTGVSYVNKRIMQLLKLADLPDIRQIFLSMGKHSGKTFFSSCMTCWTVYKLVCMRPSPQEAIQGLAPGSGIQLINLATDLDQAKLSVFKEIQIKIDGTSDFRKWGGSPWFKRLGYKMFVTKFKIPSYSIDIICTHSRAEGKLGANTVLGIIDEASHFKDSQGSKISDAGISMSLANQNFLALYGSCFTRFQHLYKIILISSPNHQGDFLVEKYNDVRKAGHPIDLDGVRTIGEYDENQNPTHDDVARAKLTEHDIGINIFRDDSRLAVKAPTWELKTYQTILDYKTEFRTQPNVTARDFGANPLRAAAPFYNFDNVRNCLYTGRESPLPYITRSDDQEMQHLDLKESPLQQKMRLDKQFIGRPDRQYYAHIDFATGGLSGKGDACGFAIAHLEDFILPNEVRDRFVVFDLVTRFQFQSSTSVDAEEVCDFIWWLTCGQRGYRPGHRLNVWETMTGRNFRNMALTLDGFNFSILIQMLTKRGLNAEYFSPDKFVHVWHESQLAFAQDRVQAYPHPVLEQEIQALQITSSGIPDHPPGGSKDILDCVVTVIHKAFKGNSANNIYGGGYKSING